MSEAARALLSRSPRDQELVHLVRSLAARAFVPAASATLPRGPARTVRHALSKRSAEERAALASALVVLPDPTTDREGAVAALELLVLVPSESERAARLCDALEDSGEDVSLQRFMLTLGAFDPRVPLSPQDLVAIEAALERVSPERRAEAERRAACVALAHLAHDPRAPHGSAWLVPCRQGESVANTHLALARRPALRDELGPVAHWLLAPDPALDAAHACDRQARGPADWERGTTLFASSLDAEDRARVLDVRAALIATRALPPHDTPRPPPLKTGLAQHLASLVSGEAAQAVVDAQALELLGDRHAAAKSWLEIGTAKNDLVSLARAVTLVAELPPGDRKALVDALRRDALTDEARLGDPDLRERARLLDRLEPDPWTSIRLAASAPANAWRSPELVTPPEAGPADSDPHHPDNRLAAASDLLAAAQLEPAANILASLLRKTDEHTPARLFTVLASALEAEEPPAELVHAAERALHDERRVVPLLEALRKAPSAAYALHEALIAFSLDPSRADADRLLALEVWLGIWRATETAPDPDALRTLREDEPALLVAAALRLSGAPSLDRLARFLADHPPDATDPDAFSDALLALSLGR